MNGQAYILIFLHKNSPRKDYIIRHVFSRILQVPFKITTTLEEFVAYNGPKFSYTTNRLGNEFHIRDTGFLNEKGIKPHFVPGVSKWEDLPVLFPAGDATVPFDFFSAAFYLISRYEEYASPMEDEHGRFPFYESLAYKKGFLEIPLIEIWIEKIRKIFVEKYPDFSFPGKNFFFRPLLSVSLSHLFKYKGFLRQFGGITENLFTFKWKKAWHRIKYGYFTKRDPYDTFDRIIHLKKIYDHPLVSFFLVGNYSHYDHNISPLRPALKKIITKMADYSDIGLLVSYYAAEDTGKFHWEKNRLEEIVHKPVEKTLLHFFKLKVPSTYPWLWLQEVKEDFSMGYPRKPGFRASTAHPFPFYDLNEESETDLLLHPVALTDYHLNFYYKHADEKPEYRDFYNGLSPEDALEIFIRYGELIRQYGGWFQPLFHNAVLSGFEEWENWDKTYIRVIKHFTGHDEA